MNLSNLSDHNQGRKAKIPDAVLRTAPGMFLLRCFFKQRIGNNGRHLLEVSRRHAVVSPTPAQTSDGVGILANSTRDCLAVCGSSFPAGHRRACLAHCKNPNAGNQQLARRPSPPNDGLLHEPEQRIPPPAQTPVLYRSRGN